MKEHIIELAKDLIRIPSVSSDVEQLHVVIDRIVEEFAEVSWKEGVSIEKLESNGKPSLVVKNHPWNRSDLSIAVHVDVVPASEEWQFEPVEKDGKLYARWACDMKSAAAASILLMKNILEQGSSKKISLLVTTDEEIWWHDGATYLADEWYWGEVMIIPDMHDISEIVIGEKWILTLNIEITWTEWHSAYPWECDSAIEKMLKMYTELKESIEETHELADEDHWGTSVQMTLCNAWKAMNVIPGSATCTVSIRHTESYTETLLKNMCKHIVTKYGWNIVSDRYGIMFLAEEDEYDIEEYKAIAEKVLWKEIPLAKCHGWTDGKKFADTWSIIIMHGPDGKNLHSKDERVDIESVGKLYEIMWEYVTL